MKITNCLKCADCAAALVVENDRQPSFPDHTYCQSECNSMSPSLISFKSYGNLINPSTSVLKTVKVTDRNLRLLVGKWSNLPARALETLQRDVLQEFARNKANCFSVTATALSRNSRTGQRFS